MGGSVIDAVCLLSLQDVGYSCFYLMILRSTDSWSEQCACWHFTEYVGCSDVVSPVCSQ